MGRKSVRLPIENGNLCALLDAEIGCAIADYKHAVVGVDADVESHFVVFGKEADVADSVVFAAAGCSHDCDVSCAVIAGVDYVFGLVVGFLFGDDADAVGVGRANIVGHRIAVADDAPRNVAATDVFCRRAVATLNAGCVL